MYACGWTKDALRMCRIRKLGKEVSALCQKDEWGEAMKYDFMFLSDKWVLGILKEYKPYNIYFQIMSIQCHG